MTETTSKSIVEILREQPFFKGLSEEYLETLADCARMVSFPAGEYLFHEGDTSADFYLIRYGRVALEIHVPGRGPLTLETLTEGDVLSWSWLVPPYRKQFSAKALTLVRALAFDGRCIVQKWDEDPKLGYELLRRFTEVIVRRLQAARLQLLDVYGQGRK